ncbi:MAG: hypothetical protein Q9227_008341 [Pyrenula ochraceoflavens]
MDTLPSLGTDILSLLPSTLATYRALRPQNLPSDRLISCSTHKYGPHERQLVDRHVSCSPNLSESASVLIFLYGGFFQWGVRTQYSPVGQFFAQHFDLTVLIPDYRLLADGAKYPSGAQDIALLLDWLSRQDFIQNSVQNVHILATSAGGIHASTFLWHPQYTALVTTHDAEEGSPSLRLKTCTLLSTPLSLKHWPWEPRYRDPMNAYYADGQVDGSDPLGLLKKTKASVLQHGPRVRILFAELDPTWVKEMATETVGVVEERMKTEHLPMRCGFEVKEVKGHNHLSHVLAIGTGIRREEEWAWELGNWIRREDLDSATTLKTKL